jgi:hypothetical protein
VSDACHFEVFFLRFRQETLFQLLLVVFITPYKRKNSAAFQKKMKIFSQPENHRLRRLHGLGPCANSKRNERTEQRRLPKKQILFSSLPSLRENPQAARLPLQARAT